MEAGVGTLLRLQGGQVDVVLVVADPSAKSIEVARRMSEIAGERSRVIVVANKVRDADDVDAIRASVGAEDVVPVPADDAIERADREGTAPLDVDEQAPGVRALVGLAERVAALRT